MMARNILVFAIFLSSQSLANGHAFRNRRDDDLILSADTALKFESQITPGLGIVIYKDDRDTEMKGIIGYFGSGNERRRRNSFELNTDHDAKGGSNDALGPLVISGENTMETRQDIGKAVLLGENQNNMKFDMPRKADLLGNNGRKNRHHGNKRINHARNIRHWCSRGQKVFDALVSRIQ